jgi:hypothetical protein
LLQIVNDVGRFDIGGNIITFGDKARDDPPKVFLTVIQPDGTFKPVDHLSKDPPVQEVGLQQLFLRSSAPEKAEADKTPDRREEANARVQDCAPDAERSSGGTQCAPTRASTVAAATRTGSPQEPGSTQNVTVPRRASGVEAPRQERRSPPVQHAAKKPHRIARALQRAEPKQPAPPLAKAAYSFAFGSSCSCATRGF